MLLGFLKIELMFLVKNTLPTKDFKNQTRGDYIKF